jgi:hypothetical protein
MSWKRHILVLANVTATSEELYQELQRRSAEGGARVTLVVPASPLGDGRALASSKLEEALARLKEMGLEAEGQLGDADPCVAVSEVWDPKRFDEILISTLPLNSSKWLHTGLPERVERLTGASVSHVVARPPGPPPPHGAPPRHDDTARLRGPLAVLRWGGHRDETPPRVKSGEV